MPELVGLAGGRRLRSGPSRSESSPRFATPPCRLHDGFTPAPRSVATMAASPPRTHERSGVEMKRAGFGFLWLILGIVTLGIVGSLAYNAGLTAGLAASASQTAVAVVPAYGLRVRIRVDLLPDPVPVPALRPGVRVQRSPARLGPWRLRTRLRRLGRAGLGSQGRGAGRSATAHPGDPRALARRCPRAGRRRWPGRRTVVRGATGTSDGRLTLRSLSRARMRPSVASGPSPAAR